MAEQDKNINEKHISETGNSRAVSLQDIKYFRVEYDVKQFLRSLYFSIMFKVNWKCRALNPTSFFIFEETAPTTGHEHIHIYCRFSQPKTIKPKNVFGAHIEVCKGSPEQNIAYIKKDGNILDEIDMDK